MQGDLGCAVTDLTKITGQKPLITKSRRRSHPSSCGRDSRWREGHAAWNSHVRVPRPADQHCDARIRDFRGVSARSFDGQGNYSLGVKEQIIFPEIQYDQVDQIRGMDITITTTAVDTVTAEHCSSFQLPIPEVRGILGLWRRRAWSCASDVAPRS